MSRPYWLEPAEREMRLAELEKENAELLDALKGLAMEINANGVDERIPDAYRLNRPVTAGSLREMMSVIRRAEGGAL